MGKRPRVRLVFRGHAPMEPYWHEPIGKGAKAFVAEKYNSMSHLGKPIRECNNRGLMFKNKNKSKAKNPFNCMVGCDNCGIYCPTGAISFPQENRRKFIQSLLKKYNIIAKAREKVVG